MPPLIRGGAETPASARNKEIRDVATLTFLGTSAALPTAARANVVLAVRPDGGAPGLLIDCGGDVFRELLRAGFGPDGIGDVFITHAHIDHIGSLPSLLEGLRLAGRTQPLRIHALPDVLDVAHRLIAAFDFEITLDDWTYDVSFSAVRDGQQFTLAGVAARVATMDHAVPCAGLRLDLPGGAFAYTSDTQPTPSARVLGQGARVFATECTYLSRDRVAARKARHSTAREAAEQAAACGAQTLVLVHVGPWSPEDIRAEAAGVFAGEIVIPADGDTLAL